MARMNNDAQWIVMMGFMVSVGLFFLALVISQSTLVGQTTAEGVLEFQKIDIQDVRHEALQMTWRLNQGSDSYADYYQCNEKQSCLPLDMEVLSSLEKGAIVNVIISLPPGVAATIHYNNGVTVYDWLP